MPNTISISFIFSPSPPSSLHDRTRSSLGAGLTSMPDEPLPFCKPPSAYLTNLFDLTLLSNPLLLLSIPTIFPPSYTFYFSFHWFLFFFFLNEELNWAQPSTWIESNPNVNANIGRGRLSAKHTNTHTRHSIRRNIIDTSSTTGEENLKLHRIEGVEPWVARILQLKSRTISKRRILPPNSVAHPHRASSHPPILPTIGWSESITTPLSHNLKLNLNLSLVVGVAGTVLPRHPSILLPIESRGSCNEHFMGWEHQVNKRQKDG